MRVRNLIQYSFKNVLSGFFSIHPLTRMSITTSWQRRSTRSRRNWRRRGARGSRNNLAWWAQQGRCSLVWLNPTPWAQDRQSDLPVSNQILWLSYFCNCRLLNAYGFILILTDGPGSMPNMPNQMLNRMQVPQGMCAPAERTVIYTVCPHFDNLQLKMNRKWRWLISCAKLISPI